MGGMGGFERGLHPRAVGGPPVTLRVRVSPPPLRLRVEVDEEAAPPCHQEPAQARRTLRAYQEPSGRRGEPTGRPGGSTGRPDQ